MPPASTRRHPTLLCQRHAPAARCVARSEQADLVWVAVRFGRGSPEPGGMRVGAPPHIPAGRPALTPASVCSPRALRGRSLATS